MPANRVDQLDVKILDRLQDDARVSNVTLAEAAGLSPSPCLRRVRALERQGVIRRYVTLLDPDAVGLPVSVFVSVTLDKQVEEALEVFERAVRQRPEVMECYLMTGESDYLLRVVASDLAAYQRFLMDHLTRVPGVANIKSSFALRQVQYRTGMPLAQLAPSPSAARTIAAPVVGRSTRPRARSAENGAGSAKRRRRVARVRRTGARGRR